MHFNRYTILVPLFIVLASATIFAVHFDVVSYGQQGLSFNILHALADGGGDGGDSGGDGGDGGGDSGGDGGDSGGDGGDTGGDNDSGRDTPPPPPPPPSPSIPICTLSVSPTSVAPGGTVTLTYTSSGADTFVITG